jgi:hypothetical protein
MELPGDLWQQLGAGVVVLLLGALAGVRKRLREGKRVFPRVHVRGYISMRSPSSSPPPAHDERESDREQLDDVTTLPPPPPRKRGPPPHAR